MGAAYCFSHGGLMAEVTTTEKAPDLKALARDLDRTLSAVTKAVDAYYAAAVSVGHETGDPPAHGLDSRQLRLKLQTFVVAKLSPKPPPGRKPVLQLKAGPEARRY